MSTHRTTAIRFLALTTAYLVTCWSAQWFMLGPDQVTLIWPPAGIGLAAFLLFGWRLAVPSIVLALLVFHLLISPVASGFIVFSLASNIVAAWLGAWLIDRFAPHAIQQLSMRSGFVFFVAAILSVLVGALIGAIGLVYAEMVPAAALWTAFLRWSLGDLFGIAAVFPTTIVLARWSVWHASFAMHFRYPGDFEKTIWALIFASTLLLIVGGSRESGPYAMGLASLTVIFSVWAAVRFEPYWSLTATSVIALFLATLIGLGHAGLAPPQDTASAAILILYLCIITITPQIVAAATHENRVAGWRALRRASIDALTGLTNRTAFEDQMRRLLASGNRESMALAYIDVDQFQLVNDTVSHAVGDDMLRSLAAALRTEVRELDLFARLGGDEFAVLLRNCDPNEGEARARQLRQAVANFRFAHGERLIAPTASIGVVPFEAAEARFSDVLAQADAACYAAKELGGNRVHVAHLGDVELKNRQTAMDWAVKLSDAIEQDRLQLFAQGIETLKYGKPQRGLHLEILLRVTDSVTGEAMPPGPYIAAAERFKFGVRLDRTVVSKTLDWLNRNDHARQRVGVVSINLSAASLVDDDFMQFLENAVTSSRVRPEQICFEITETSAVRDLAMASRFIQRVRSLGCKFALDDFGAGFCSFAYLKSLDVDYFKIDGSFVRDVHQSPLALAIVRSIAEIARVMGKQTIAEYTESETIRAHLIALGVDYAQGYAINRPAPLATFFLPADPGNAIRQAS